MFVAFWWRWTRCGALLGVLKRAAGLPCLTRVVLGVVVLRVVRLCSMVQMPVRLGDAGIHWARGEGCPGLPLIQGYKMPPRATAVRSGWGKKEGERAVSLAEDGRWAATRAAHYFALSGTGPIRLAYLLGGEPR